MDAFWIKLAADDVDKELYETGRRNYVTQRQQKGVPDWVDQREFQKLWEEETRNDVESMAKIRDIPVWLEEMQRRKRKEERNTESETAEP